MIHGAVESTMPSRARVKRQSGIFRREMGNVVYALERPLSKAEHVVNPGNRGIE